MFVLGETPMPETLEDAHKLIEEVAKERDTEKEHSRTWEKRTKENKDAAPLLDKATARIAELEADIAKLETERDSGKSDVQKQLEKITADLEAEKGARAEAEKAAAADRMTALRTRIGTEKGLPSALIELLKGDDEEAITAHADTLLEAIPAPAKKPGVPGQGHHGKPPEKDTLIAAIDAGFDRAGAAKPKE